MFTKWPLLAVVTTVACSRMARAQTVETNTFADINSMATMWEGNPSQITSLVNTQYPAFNGNTWQYIFPVSSIEADGDIHIDMAVNSSGSGKTGNNNGESPIICEVVNASNAQLAHVKTVSSAQALPVGIFRFYTEHQGERHFEFHPLTQLLTWNASSNAFLPDSDYHANITNDPNATTHLTSTLQEVFNGEDRMVATVMPDNNHLIFTWQSPSVNYVQYGGIAMSGLTNDFVSQYFLFEPTSPSPSNTPVIARCRIITNTTAATLAAGLISNQTLTVNALTRTDMLVVSNAIAGMTSGQSTNVARPVELITLGIFGLGSVPPPVANFSGSPTNGSAPLTVTFTDTSTGSITNRFWSFGDGGTSNTLATSVQHVYPTAGSNSVTLIVSGLGGSKTNAKPNYILVSSGAPPPPVASFMASPTSGAAPLSVSFTDGSSGTITGWAWTFGDGNTSTIQSPSDVYVNPGTYTVQEIVSGPSGSGTDTVANLVSVYDPFAWWQLNYFGSTNNPNAAPGGDSTGTGMSNTNKFLAGFNPTNPAVYLHIINIVEQLAGGNTNVVVTYLGPNGDNTYTPGSGSRTNVLDCMTGDANGNYTNGGWQDTGQTNNLSGGNGSGTITNMTDVAIPSTPTNRYYRVRVLLP